MMLGSSQTRNPIARNDQGSLCARLSPHYLPKVEILGQVLLKAKRKRQGQNSLWVLEPKAQHLDRSPKGGRTERAD